MSAWLSPNDAAGVLLASARGNNPHGAVSPAGHCPRHGRMKNRYEGNRQRLSSCRTVVQDRSIGARKAWLGGYQRV